MHLLGPISSLVLDPKNFCQPILRAKLFLSLAVCSFVLANMALLVPTSHIPNLFSLFNFVQTFRFEFLGIMIAECILYFLLLNSMRRFLTVYERRRLHPAV